jgi:TRAP-type C4-dicarboxylate transport system permease small subunit
MDMGEKSKTTSTFKTFLLEGESYFGGVIFVVLTILLTLQVITRYVFNHSFTWSEELSILLYIPMVYACVAAAVYKRKMIKISMIVDNLPFKWRKVCLILSNVLFMVFCGFIFYGYQSLIRNLGNAVTTVMRFPIKIIYWTIPILHVLIFIRLVQDTIRLWKEGEQELGVGSKPMVDLDEYEKQYLDMKGKKAVNHTPEG